MAQVLIWWIKYHWHDFGVSSELRDALDDFIMVMAENSALCLKEMNQNPIEMIEEQVLFQSIKILLSKTAFDTKRLQANEFDEKYSYTKTVEKKSKSMESMLLQLSPEDLAQQISIHNFTLFHNIHPSEFLDQIWRKDDESTTPYLTTFIQRFDKEYYWVATEVVCQKDLKKRIAILKTFILAAKVI